MFGWIDSDVSQNAGEPQMINATQCRYGNRLALQLPNRIDRIVRKQFPASDVNACEHEDWPTLIDGGDCTRWSEYR